MKIPGKTRAIPTPAASDAGVRPAGVERCAACRVDRRSRSEQDDDAAGESQPRACPRLIPVVEGGHRGEPAEVAHHQRAEPGQPPIGLPAGKRQKHAERGEDREGEPEGGERAVEVPVTLAAERRDENSNDGEDRADRTRCLCLPLDSQSPPLETSGLLTRAASQTGTTVSRGFPQLRVRFPDAEATVSRPRAAAAGRALPGAGTASAAAAAASRAPARTARAPAASPP